MKIEVINTGSEILLGNTINTNLALIAENLFPLGIRIDRQTTVPDSPVISKVIQEALQRADGIIITGGLGPTSDDMTREILSEIIHAPLEFQEPVWKSIQEFFYKQNRDVPESNRKQAFVPRGAQILPNAHGTAPGLWICSQWENKDRLLVLLPGPPRELGPMLTNEVIPRLKARMQLQPTIQVTWSIVGIGESVVADQVETFLKNLDDSEYGYCARNGQVDIRLICKRDSLIERAEIFFRKTFGDRIFRSDGKTIESILIDSAINKQITIATAESCTGGLIAHRLTNVPGASNVFCGGWVAYSATMKETMLGIDPSLIVQNGVVSEAITTAMAEAAINHSKADISVATTGYAGPSGGSERDPIGTGYIAWCIKGKKTECERFFFPLDRETFKQRITQIALDGLRIRIQSLPSPIPQG
jgi:nicotinamide-nucleotide amidase